MAWSARSNRRASLGKDYFRNRHQVMKRDGWRCQIRTPGICIDPVPANQCDHIDHRDDHSVENMRAACTPCHAHRSGQQGGAAAGQRRTARAAARFRPQEQHPGAR